MPNIRKRFPAACSKFFKSNDNKIIVQANIISRCLFAVGLSKLAMHVFIYANWILVKENYLSDKFTNEISFSIKSFTETFQYTISGPFRKAFLKCLEDLENNKLFFQEVLLERFDYMSFFNDVSVKNGNVNIEFSFSYTQLILKNIDKYTILESATLSLLRSYNACRLFQLSKSFQNTRGPKYYNMKDDWKTFIIPENVLLDFLNIPRNKYKTSRQIQKYVLDVVIKEINQACIESNLNLVMDYSVHKAGKQVCYALYAHVLNDFEVQGVMNGNISDFVYNHRVKESESKYCTGNLDSDYNADSLFPGHFINEKKKSKKKNAKEAEQIKDQLLQPLIEPKSKDEDNSNKVYNKEEALISGSDRNVNFKKTLDGGKRFDEILENFTKHDEAKNIFKNIPIQDMFSINVNNTNASEEIKKEIREKFISNVFDVTKEDSLTHKPISRISKRNKIFNKEDDKRTPLKNGYLEEKKERVFSVKEDKVLTKEELRKITSIEAMKTLEEYHVVPGDDVWNLCWEAVEKTNPLFKNFCMSFKVSAVLLYMKNHKDNLEDIPNLIYHEEKIKKNKVEETKEDSRGVVSYKTENYEDMENISDLGDL